MQIKAIPVTIEIHEFSDEQLKDRVWDMKYKRLPDEVNKYFVYKPTIQTAVEHNIAVYAGDDSQAVANWIIKLTEE